MASRIVEIGWEIFPRFDRKLLKSPPFLVSCGETRPFQEVRSDR